MEVKILKLHTRQDGKLIITFLADGKKQQLENREFTRRYESQNDWREHNENRR